MIRYIDTDLYIVLVSPHGLIRGQNLELGRDADTGGQTQYVVELAKALARHPDVGRVDLLTRQVFDAKVSEDYAEPMETLSDKASIVRLPCGPRRYLRKEVLWPYLDVFNDNALQHIRRVGRVPDVIHSHYADGGYVGTRLASLLGIPLVHTGHSLGRVKRQRLLDQGMRAENIDSHYNMAPRIEAEEFVLDSAAVVVASTNQEVEEQYSVYDNYEPGRMVVIPPGVDLGRFYPPRRGEWMPPIWDQLQPFLQYPRRPIILALSRPDERKNIQTLVRAYGENQRLRGMANLVIVAGNRDDIRAMDRGARNVITEILLLVDRYNLYGSVAIPKRHESVDVPHLYRLAAKSHGVFVNPALTEPFGLTLIEAAASGLPIVATRDGGPKDILRYCHNGVLIDPLDHHDLSKALEHVLENRGRWRKWSKNGVTGAHKNYSWDRHVEQYLKAIRETWKGKTRQRDLAQAKSRLPTVDRILICDLDETLLGDARALRALLQRMQKAGEHVGFGVATGRSYDSALKVLREWNMPMPDLLITSVGAEIHYGHQHVRDHGWERHIDYRWEPDDLRAAMKEFPGLKAQPKSEQHAFKISYYVDEKKALSVRDMVRHLRQQHLHAKLIQSRGMFLDLLPIRASKGLALRYLGVKWGLSPERFLVAGDSGNDEEMLRGNTLGLVVFNYSKEITRLKTRPRIYFARGKHAWGVIEGLDYYNFLGDIRIPSEISPDN